MKKTSLVLEGGGFRSSYTLGVLQGFIDNSINFNYIVGVSAGALAGALYLANQVDRIFKVNMPSIDFSGAVEKQTGLLDMVDYYTILNNFNPALDFKRVLGNDADLLLGAVEIETNTIIYFSNKDIETPAMLNCTLAASSALPGLAVPVTIHGQEYYDGGMMEPIPIIKAAQDGYDKHIVILTQNKGYFKENSHLDQKIEETLKPYPQFLKTVQQRYLKYNHMLDEIEEMEKKGIAFVFRPTLPMDLKVFDDRIDVAKNIYMNGYTHVTEKMDELLQFLG